MRKAVCVTSGGMDSISMGLACLKEGYEITYFHCDLKQKAETPERRAVLKIANLLNVNSKIVDIGWLGQLGGSSLTDSRYKVPKGMDSIEESTNIYSNLDEPGLWTPGRNVVMLACAAAYAEAIGAELLTWGANQSETAYPDNTLDFAVRFSHMLKMGCLRPPRVDAPLYHLDKPQILKWGFNGGFGNVYDHTWSCDEGIVLSGDLYAPCGVCGCCMNRRLAFAIAHAEDDRIVDNQVYHDPDYYEQVYLKDLHERCTPQMWMHKYLERIPKP